jgi:hypothetical protein
MSLKGIDETFIYDNKSRKYIVIDKREKRRLYIKEYYNRPEVKKRKNEYNNRPETIEKRKIYSKIYRQKPEVIARAKLYHKRPEVIEYARNYSNMPQNKLKIKLYHQKYNQRPEVKVKRREWSKNYWDNSPIADRRRRIKMIKTIINRQNKLLKILNYKFISYKYKPAYPEIDMVMGDLVFKMDNIKEQNKNREYEIEALEKQIQLIRDVHSGKGLINTESQSTASLNTETM